MGEAKFTMVDGGLGNLAFWNARHNRYIRLKVDVWLWPPAELRSAVSTERGMYQTTQFEPGASDSSCNDDGSAWNVAKVVCPFARSTHESLVNVAKNACSSLAKLNGCWLYSR